MENRYYTPELREFYIGFEYEYLDNDEWRRSAVQDDGHIELQHKSVSKGIIRVKHLDREDIESLGFKASSGDRDYEYPGKSYQLEILKDDSIYITSNYGVTTLFNGIIKNKSELKVLLKQIGL